MYNTGERRSGVYLVTWDIGQVNLTCDFHDNAGWTVSIRGGQEVSGADGEYQGRWSVLEVGSEHQGWNVSMRGGRLILMMAG